MSNKATLVVAVVSILVNLTLVTAAPAAPTYFVVEEFPGNEHNGDSYILPLNDPDDIAHARDLILSGPQVGAPLVVANIRAGLDRINRNWLAAQGRALWFWHVTEFVGFADATIEILDGSPTMVESDVSGWIENTNEGTGDPDVGQIGFWNYTVTEEVSAPVIDKVKPRPCEPKQKIRIMGFGFGDTQGDSVIHIGKKAFDSSSPRIKLWTDTKIKVRIRDYPCKWFGAKESRNRRVSVTVAGEDSNRKKFKVVPGPNTCEPNDCSSCHLSLHWGADLYECTYCHSSTSLHGLHEAVECVLCHQIGP